MGTLTSRTNEERNACLPNENGRCSGSNDERQVSAQTTQRAFHLANQLLRKKRRFVSTFSQKKKKRRGSGEKNETREQTHIELSEINANARISERRSRRSAGADVREK